MESSRGPGRKGQKKVAGTSDSGSKDNQTCQSMSNTHGLGVGYCKKGSTVVHTADEREGVMRAQDHFASEAPVLLTDQRRKGSFAQVLLVFSHGFRSFSQIDVEILRKDFHDMSQNLGSKEVL